MCAADGMLIGLVVLACGSASGQLLPAQQFDTQAIAGSLATGDVDGDGHLDLALCGTHQVSVLLGDGPGGFGPPISLNVELTSNPAVGDLDHDGLDDVVVSGYYDSRLSMFLSLGAGTFAVPADLPGGPLPEQVIIADADGDGHPDLLDVCAAGDGSVELRRGDGTGAFPEVSYWPAPLQSDLEVSDVDLDGTLDLLVGSYAAVSLLKGDGTGGFHPVETISECPLFTYCLGPNIAVLDANHDGAPDIIADSGLSLLLGDGAGTFERFAHLQGLEEVTDYSSLVVADVDGDGWSEVAFVAWENDGGYEENRHLVMAEVGPEGFAEPVELYADTNCGRLLAADFNEDGLSDLATLDAFVPVNVDMPVVTIMYARASGGLGTLEQGLGGHATQLLAAIDLDVDGHLDVVTLDNYFGTIDVFLGTGAGVPVELAWQTGAGDAALEKGHDIVAGDITGDGLPDVIILKGNFKLDSHLAAGGGLLGEAIEQVLPVHSPTLALGAFDGDGFPDLVVVQDQAVQLLSGQGDGHFVAGTSVAFGKKLIGASVADLDADGLLDVVVAQDKPSALDSALGDGTGGFSTTTSLKGSMGVLFALGDIDADGHLDVITSLPAPVGTKTEQFAFAYLGKGDGSFASLPGKWPLHDDNIKSLGLADLDGDGRADLFASEAEDRVAVLRGDGAAGFAPANFFHVTVPGETVPGDFVEDGRLDLLCGQQAYDGAALALLPGQTLDGPWTDLHLGLAGEHGVPQLSAAGTLAAHSPVTLRMQGGPSGTAAVLLAGTSIAATPFKSGVLVPALETVIAGLTTDASGELVLSGSVPSGLPTSSSLVVQTWLADEFAPAGYSASNGLLGLTP